MGMAAMVSGSIGIVLVILSCNGRLQNVIAAAFGQQPPGATPVGGSQGTNTPSTGAGNPFGWIPGLFGFGSLLTGSGQPGGGGSGSNSGDGGYTGNWGDNYA